MGYLRGSKGENKMKEDYFRIHKEDFRYALVNLNGWEDDDFEKCWKSMQDGKMDVTDMWNALQTTFHNERDKEEVR